MDRWRRRFWILLAIVVGVPLLIGIVLAMRFLPDRPVTYANIEDHFKYGSTGGERNAGFPLWMWKALPVVFADKLPRNGRAGYEAFGMIYEDESGMVYEGADEGPRRRELPVGMMKRRHLGIDRVFVNCAACHATTVREAPDKRPKLYVATGAARFDLGLLEKFLSDIVVDERFTAGALVPAMEEQSGGRLSVLDRYLIYPVAVALTRERLLMLRDRFLPMGLESWGPGRVDTWNSAKSGLNFKISLLPEHERRGATDFPSIWNQRKRKHRDDGQPMELHWTGNNTDVNERNLSAAFGTGCTPATVDHAAIERLQVWLLDAAPPAFPEGVSHRRGEGRSRRGGLRAVLRELPWQERPGLQRPVRRTRHTDRRRRHRPPPLRLVHVRPERGPEYPLRRHAVSIHAFPEDRWLRQRAAGRHLAARPVPAQRIGADAARASRSA